MWSPHRHMQLRMQAEYVHSPVLCQPDSEPRAESPPPKPPPPLSLLRPAPCASLYAQLGGGGLEAANSYFIFSLEAAASWIDSEAVELRRRVYLPFGPTPLAVSASLLICSSLTEPRRPATRRVAAFNT